MIGFFFFCCSSCMLLISSLCLASSSCIEEEKQALLEFKADVNDTTSGRFSSWIGDNCCSWRGVGCNNITRHVIKLDLRGQVEYEEATSLDINGDLSTYVGIPAKSYFSSNKISPSLLKLKHLNYLDLSFNNFQGTHIPEFMGSLENLMYLNLACTSVTGAIPPQLGNLSRLHYLDLQSCDDELTIDNIQWVSGLPSLRYLNMESVRFSGTSSTDWIKAVSMLPSLAELDLTGCQLSDAPLSLPYANFSSLQVLRLVGNNFYSSISPWLFNISSLTVLDLSYNSLSGPIPDTFAKTSSLQSLDISYTSVEGKLPKTLGNLCNLVMLDLSSCGVNGEITDYVNSLSMCSSKSLLEILHFGVTAVSGLIPSSIGNLTSLTELDLSSTHLSGQIPTSIGNLSSLIKLNLSSTQLSGSIIRSIGNFPSLRTLDLSETQITGAIPLSIGRLLSLRTLDLHETQITGAIPMSIGRLSSLRILDLSNTQIGGPIPLLIGGLSSLMHLDLSNSQVNGTIPESIGELSELVELKITESSLSGVISKAHFKNMKILRELNIVVSNVPNSPLVFEINGDWIPTFSLETIYLANIHMGPKFPSWLATQKNLDSITLRKVGISDTIPESIWNLCARQAIYNLDLSQNQIRGSLPSSLKFCNAGIVDPSSNKIEGHFPLWSNVTELYLGNNLFIGQIPHNISEVLGSGVSVLDFSGNFLNGSIPSSICQLSNLELLVLSTNGLWGELPYCLTNMNYLVVLDLSNNNLSGKIPQSICNLSSLRILVLNNNSFHGKLPPSLQNCTSLKSIDLGSNGLSGNIPTWIGDSLSYLKLISFSSNFFTGGIPSQVCNLSWLHMLDLSHNKLLGFIPQCLGELSSLGLNETGISEYGGYMEQMKIILKGREFEYSSTLGLVNSFDLSSNHLSGKIPNGITKLVRLGSLNLSMNHLTGKIRDKIGDMRYLETLPLHKPTFW